MFHKHIFSFSMQDGMDINFVVLIGAAKIFDQQIKFYVLYQSNRFFKHLGILLHQIMINWVKSESCSEIG